jgi:hypothetical protein
MAACKVWCRLQRSTPPLRQHGEPIVEPRGEALDAEYVDARGCQFERERHPVKPAANLEKACIVSSLLSS